MSTTELSTIPRVLAQHAHDKGDAVALRSKRHGLWQTITYGQLARRVGAVAAGLRAIGVMPGTTVALIAENSPHWVVADLAVQSLGARSVALAPQTPAPTAVRVLAACGAVAAVCGDQEQVDLVLEAGPALAAIAGLVVIDPTGTAGYDEPRLRTLADVEATGEGLAAPDLAAVDPSAETVGLCSAGTSGDPRVSAHSAASMMQTARNAAEWLQLTSGDRNLAVLSLATPASRLLDVYATLIAGGQIVVPESPATVAADLLEVSPSVLCVSPRALELLRQSSMRRAGESSRVRRATYRWALRALAARLDKNERARTLAGARRGRGLPYLLVGRWIASALGVLQTRRIVVTGGSVAARDARFFWSLGVPVLETYGQAETGGLVCAHDALDDAGTIGRPLPGVGARIGEDGTLAVTSVAAPEVWHATGDLAEEAGDGRLRIRGRHEDVVHGPGGEIVVAGLEAALRDCPYIRRAVAAGDGSDGLTAFVEVDLEETAPWANERDIVFSTYNSLVTRPEVRELVDAEVAAANERTGSAVPISDVVILPRQLSVHDGELTPLLTVRRARVIELHTCASGT
jgi:long-chain acyl-CoA synthetase